MEPRPAPPSTLEDGLTDAIKLKRKLRRARKEKPDGVRQERKRTVRRREAKELRRLKFERFKRLHDRGLK